MASRTAQKEAARQRRLAEERARAERARRDRRLKTLGGVLVGAIAVIVVAIIVSSGASNTAAPTPTSPGAKHAASTVDSLLAGIPQSGNTLGSPSAKVTLTEYGDLVCPDCKAFALGAEQQLIANDVRRGKVKIVYQPLETASQTANGSMFVPSQAAALAAGQQKRGWNYIELFYHEQGAETSSYVTDNYLGGLARQIPGLNYSQWSADRQSSSLTNQVNQNLQAAPRQGLQLHADARGAGHLAGQADRRRHRLRLLGVSNKIRVVRLSLRRLMLALAVIGLGVASYLTIVHYAGLNPACTAGTSCVKVQTSQWSKLDGVPVALLGLIGYVGIVASLIAPDREETRLATLGLTLIGFGFSAYLTYRELFSIHAICEWCVSSAVILTLLLIGAIIRYLNVPDLAPPPPPAPAPLPPKRKRATAGGSRAA